MVVGFRCVILSCIQGYVFDRIQDGARQLAVKHDLQRLFRHGRDDILLLGLRGDIFLGRKPVYIRFLFYRILAGSDRRQLGPGRRHSIGRYFDYAVDEPFDAWHSYIERFGPL